MIEKLHLLLIILYFFVISLIYLHTTDTFNQDLGRHLKLGEIIWETKQVPKTNLFSYTNPNEPVFNSHWGSQVIFYTVHKTFGVNGLILLSTIINTAAFGMLFVLAVRRVGFLIPSVLFIPFAFILLDRSWIRPEMFGNLFYATLLVALFVKKARDRLKWFFPVIALLWINLHITAVFGVFAMGVVLLQDIIESENKKKSIVVNLLLLACCLVGLMINPYGIEGVLSALTVLNKYGYTIVENQSWFFLRGFGFPLVFHILLGFIVLILSLLMTIRILRRPLLGEAILLVVISILTLRFVRNETLFAYSVFLITAFTLGQLQKVFPKGLRQGQTVIVSLILLLIGSIIVVHSHNTHQLPLGFGNKESYKAGLDFFLANNLQGPVFNNFDIGGYLIYRLYPKNRVFVDNRPEAYPVSFFEDVYKEMQFHPDVFHRYEEQYKLKTIIWGKRDITPWSYAFLQNMANDSQWKSIYDDGVMVIYTKSP